MSAVNQIQRPVSSERLIAAAMALLAIGLVMVGSAAATLDRPVLESTLWESALGRQLVFSGLAVLAMLATARVAPYVLASEVWRRRLSWVMLVVVILLLSAALVPGLTEAQRGSQRWLRLGIAGLRFQPSEFAKPVLVAALAAWFSRKESDPRSLARSFIPAAGIIGLIVLLVGSQNLGTAILLSAVGFGVLLVAGSRLSHLALISSIGVLGLAGLLYDKPYRMDRITAHNRLWDDTQAGSYQPMQSLVSIASGGWWGTGLGSGIQKYGYLPENRTDFIFSALCEETGLLGACVVIGLFGAILWLGLRTAWLAPSPYERLLAFGLTLAMTLQAAMNIAVVTVLIPTTGISLPLISAGGSGTIAYGISIGLLAAVASRCTTCPAR